MLKLGRRTFDDDRLLIMAIVNRTPDSFYDKGATFGFEPALQRVREWSRGRGDRRHRRSESSAGRQVTPEEEIGRIVALIAAVRAEFPDVVISVDTWRAEVAPPLATQVPTYSMTHGAERSGARLRRRALRRGTGVHSCRGAEPRTRPHRVSYDDVVADVVRRTVGEAERAAALGVNRDSVLIDPGHDFGKNTRHSLEVTRRLGELVATGWPVLVSLSNKDFVGEIAGSTCW